MVLTKQHLFEGISLIRPLLILFVCIAHMPGIAGYTSNFDQFDQLGTLFSVYLKDFLARGAVPILTVISGYLAYSSFKKRSYKTFVIDKVNSLLLPFLLWNTIVLILCWTAWFFFQQSYGGIKHVDSFNDAVKAVIGIYRLPINAPTYFLRDLFMLMLIVPFIHFICGRLDRFVVAFLTYLIVFWSSPGIAFPVFGVIIPLTFRMDMVLFFAVGYLFATRQQECPKISAFSGTVFAILMGTFGILFSMVTSGLTPSAETFVQWRMMLGGLFFCVAPAILSGLISIKDTSFGRLLAWLSPYSFTLFLSHTISAYAFMYISRVKLGWLVSNSSPILEQVLYTLVYLVTVSLGAILVLTFWKKLLKYSPQETRKNLAVRMRSYLPK